ncbi:MAG: hypothetical protein M5R40_07555 [Anaerolineae bacterium]|nr:hypothetical protein [Anaerolineae bacterium]
MRPRNPVAENTSFQEAGPFLPQVDIKTDVAMVYGLTATFEERLAAWKAAGYRPHVMTGVAWGEYQDYVRGQWDGIDHHDDAQMDAGPFPLEHGISQGRDVYYMVPTRPYTAYLAEQLRRVVDGGAIAIHLEEPEFWARGGHSPSFKEEWLEFYGEPWQDPVSSVDARYRASRLMQHLYTRALDTLMRSLKTYAAEKGVPNFTCYVPTHSLLNYTHWHIVSPEAKLLAVDACDGIIAQVWTGTARTPNVYRGVKKQRTFETAYCEYASAAAMVRGVDFRLWMLADPIEDNPNYAWPDYRRNWECTVTASLFFPETARFEVTPWPSRVFLRTYPKENLSEKPLLPLLSAYMARLERNGETEKLNAAREAFAAFQRFFEERLAEGKPLDTLGFAHRVAEPTRDLRFGDVLALGSAFYQHLSGHIDEATDKRYRGALADFFHDPTDEREHIPPEYATELQVVFNALADMDWPAAEVEWVDAPAARVALGITDTMMFQRGEPSPSDPDLSFVYGLTLPLLKHGLPFQMVHLERLTDPGYLNNGLETLILTYEGMKPPAVDAHHAIAGWVEAGGMLLLFGDGDEYDTVRSWWNNGERSYRRAQDHLTDMLGLGIGPAPGVHPVGKGKVLIAPDSPSALARRADGADAVWQLLNQVIPVQPRNALILRRGPYVVAAGLDESVSDTPVALPGVYVDLYDAGLAVRVDPAIAPDTRHFLIDVARADPGHAWVLAASGRVDAESHTADTLSCTVSGAAGTVMVMRALLPRTPKSVEAGDHAVSHTWDARSRTVFVTGPADPAGVPVVVRF